MYHNHIITALALAILLTGAGPYTADNITCYDGDTCTMDFDLGLDLVLRQQTVRLCDINAPELKGASKSAGVASRDYLRMLLTQTSTASVEVVINDNARDNFGRWLGYLYLDGKSINALMVQSGHAAPYGRTCAP